MIEEQSFEIPLDSPLDANSNDMLVSIQQPKFQYNRQKYQGSLLQTSCRYEDDGYFAGWWGHQFEVQRSGNNHIEPPLGAKEAIQVMTKKNTLLWEYTVVLQADTGLSFNYSLDTKVDWFTSAVGTVERISDSVVKVTGNTSKGSSYVASINPYTGKIDSFSSSNASIKGKSSVSGSGEIQLEVALEQNIGFDFFKVHKNGKVSYRGLSLAYTRDETTSYWKNGELLLFSLVDTMKVVSHIDELVIISQVTEHAGTGAEVIKAVVRNDSVGVVESTVGLVSKWNRVSYDEVKPQQDRLGNANSALNTVFAGGSRETGFDIKEWNKETKISYWMPIWLKFASKWSQNISIKAEAALPVPTALTVGIDFKVEKAERKPLVYFETFTISKYNIFGDEVKVDKDMWRDVTGGSDTLSANYVLDIPTIPRYSDIVITLPKWFRCRDEVWNPYKKIANPAYDPRKRIAKPSPPEGCMNNPLYNGEKYIKNPAKDDITVITDLDLERIDDVIANPKYNTELYKALSATDPAYIKNLAYDSDPLSDSYDPRPVIKATGSASWLDVSEENGAYDSFATIDNPDYNVVRIYNRLDTIVIRDYEKASEFWDSYWKDIPYPRFTKQKEPEKATYQYTTYGEVSYSPERKTIPPVDAEGTITPPYIEPCIASMTLNFKEMGASVHTIHTDNSKIGSDWQWSVRGATYTKIIDKDRNIKRTVRYWNAFGETDNLDIVWANSDFKLPATFEVGNALEALKKETAEDAEIGKHVFSTVYFDFQVINRYNEFFVLPKGFVIGNCNFTNEENQLFTLKNTTPAFSKRNAAINSFIYLIYFGRNRIASNDTDMISTTKDAINIVLPVCITAFSMGTVKAVDIVKEDKTSFTYTEIPNEEGSIRFRFDSNGGKTDNMYTLQLAKGSVTNVEKQGGVDGKITVTFESIGVVPFYKALVADVEKIYDEKGTETGERVIPGVFPKWMIDNNPISVSDKMGIVYAGEKESTAVTVTVKTTLGSYIENLTPSIKAEKDSLFNKGLFDKSTPIVQWDPPKSGVFFQKWEVGIDDITKNRTVGYYNVDLKVYGVTENIYEDYAFVRLGLPTDINKVLKVFFRKVIVDNVDFYRTFIYEYGGFVKPTLKIVKQEGLIVFFNSNYGKSDITTPDLDGTAVQVLYTDVTATTVTFFVGISDFAKVTFLPKGIFWKNDTGIEYKSIAKVGDTVEVGFNYNGASHVAYIDSKSESSLVYGTKDIRTGEYKESYRRDLSDVQMYLKQFWSGDVSTENFWWIDATHVLQLTKFDMILHRKVAGKVTDWAGDVWEVQKSAPRSNFIGTEDLYYSVSSLYNPNNIEGATAQFFKIQENAEGITILELYDILGADFNKPLFYKTYCGVSKRDFGKNLRGGAQSARMLCSYTELNVGALIGGSKISSTSLYFDDKIGGVLLIGIAYGKGLNQWTLNNSNGDVITGYGHVGVDGTLTGGQLPSLVCDGEGFKKIVYDVSTLKEFSKAVEETPDNPVGLPNKCFGSGNNVYFVYSKIPEIVSHYRYDRDKGHHEPVTIALNNNVVTKYSSVSFSGSCVHDPMPNGIGIGTLLATFLEGPAGQALAPILSILTPSIWCLDLKYTTLSYIDHSIGSYSYVYRSNRYSETAGKGTMTSGAERSGLPEDVLEDTKQKDITEDEQEKKHKETLAVTKDIDLSFGKQSHRISFSSADTFNAGDILITVIMKAVALKDTADAYKVNEGENQTATSDEKGRKLAQFAIDNTVGTVSQAILATGLSKAATSTISTAFTLNMFYCIGDDSAIVAGPGYVNHNFVGQCMAQSATDTQLNGNRLGYWVTLTGLTLLIEKQKRLIFEATRDFLNSQAADSATWTVMVLGTSAPIGSIMAPLLRALAKAADLQIQLCILGEDLIEMLAAAIGPMNCGYDSGTAKKYNSVIEFPHTYGDKPMSFFYPCFGVQGSLMYTDEGVAADRELSGSKLDLGGRTFSLQPVVKQNCTEYVQNGFIAGGIAGRSFSGTIQNTNVVCKGTHVIKGAPADMAIIEGTKSFLPDTAYKNNQIGLGNPQFSPPTVQDYIINKKWKLGQCCAGGETMWVSCDDIKVIDSAPSNIVITGSFCGVASSYTAIEVKDSYDERYLRPYAVTPNCVALNINRINVLHDTKAYHAFDGQGNRIVSWRGGAGLDKNNLYQQYSFQINDHFKRSNILPPSQFFGNFEGFPMLAIRTYDRLYNGLKCVGLRKGMMNDIPGENRQLMRFSLPIHSEQLSTLPAMVRMLAPYKLFVMNGVTSLTTDVRNGQSRYKAPTSVDFNILGDAYRATEEYILGLEMKGAFVISKDLCVKAGLQLIGSTTKEAFFFSPATRMYYSFSGSKDITKKDIINRFKDVSGGRWDFVNQEIMLKCLTQKDVLVCRLDDTFAGEVFPAIDPIRTMESDFKLYSMAGGTVYQGPKRFVVNRFVFLEHMFEDIIKNKRRWGKVSREAYSQERDYKWKYKDFDTKTPLNAVEGWTHNPYGLVTSMLGINENTDCRFEWEITFAWTEQMEHLYGNNEFACVNIQADTVTQGGMKESDAMHIFLFKECFTRSGNAGYFTMQFQSNNGIGNRERLKIWSDSIIAIEHLKVGCKQLTAKRTQPLYTQVDVQDLQEL